LGVQNADPAIFLTPIWKVSKRSLVNTGNFIVLKIQIPGFGMLTWTKFWSNTFWGLVHTISVASPILSIYCNKNLSRHHGAMTQTMVTMVSIGDQLRMGQHYHSMSFILWMWKSWKKWFRSVAHCFSRWPGDFRQPPAIRRHTPWIKS
jgi:hypothetical protein